MQEAKEGEEPRSSMGRYAAAAIMLLGLALLSYAIIPSSSSVGSCTSILISSSRYSCLTRLALLSQNASVCGYESGSYADSCYLQLAEKTNQSPTCGMIQNSTTMSSCNSYVALSTGNAALCQQTIEPYRSKCTETLALRQGSLELCAGIANLTYNTACTSAINARRALSLKNPAYCLNVSSSLDRNITYMVSQNLTAGINSTALSAGSRLTSELAFFPNTTFTPRDLCYTDLAILAQNITVCGSVTAGEGRSVCRIYSNTTANANRSFNYTAAKSACSQLGSVYQQCIDAATITQAVSTRNATLCAGLPVQFSDACYTAMAGRYKNAKYCSSIADPAQRSSCVSGAG